jgi:hypothetical protein
MGVSGAGPLRFPTGFPEVVFLLAIFLKTNLERLFSCVKVK